MRLICAATLAWLSFLLGSCASKHPERPAPSPPQKVTQQRPPEPARAPAGYSYPAQPSPQPRAPSRYPAQAPAYPQQTYPRPTYPTPAQPSQQPATRYPAPAASPTYPVPSNPPAQVAAAPTMASAMSQLDPTVYRLAAGDAVQVEVFGEESLSVTVTVDGSGSVNYPLLGLLPAGGRTVRDLQAQITSGLQNGYLVNPSVRVGIAQYRPIYVSGRVRKVGRFPYTVGLTVERAITMAGGITEFGSSRKVYLQRENASDAQREKVELDHPVLPGDTIIVEERLF